MSIATQRTAEITRVNVDDLVDEYPGYTLMTWQGKPFTGIGFEAADDGHVISESPMLME